MSAEHYSDEGFWTKAKTVLRSAGRTVLEPALQLYYAAQRPETPVWAKSIVYGALGYLILPLDAIPDALPVVGFTDDLGVLVAAVAAIAAHIDEGVKARARAKLADWFGGEQA